MQPTRARVLLLIAFVGLVLGWVVVRLVDSLAGRFLPLPWSAAVAIWLLAIGLAMWTWIVRPRLLRRPGTLPLPPPVAARTAALALAASRTGAAIGGLYAGFVVGLLADLATPAGRTYAATAAVGVVGALALTAVALWLERLCRIKPEDDSLDPAGAEEDGSRSLGAERIGRARAKDGVTAIE